MKLLPAVDENCGQLLGDMRIAAQLTILGGIPVWWCNAWHTCCGVRGFKMGRCPCDFATMSQPDSLRASWIVVSFSSPLLVVDAAQLCSSSRSW